jgi:hypothetical protein
MVLISDLLTESTMNLQNILRTLSHTTLGSWYDGETNILEQLLLPFRWFSITGFYVQFSEIIDLLIYTVIFVGLAKATLGRRLPGRGGTAVSVGVGCALAIGMTATAHRLSFTIGTLGPIASLTLVLMLGVALYRLFRYAGASRLAAASLAYIGLLLAVHVISPTTVVWISQRRKGLDTLLSLFLIASIVGVGTSIGTPRGYRDHRYVDMRRFAPQARRRERESLKREVQLVKRYAEPIIKQSSKDSKAIIRDLRSLRRAIRQKGKDPQVRQRLVRDLANIVPAQHELLRQTDNVMRMVAEMKQTDTESIPRRLRQVGDNSASKERRRRGKTLAFATRKVQLEQETTRIAQEIRKHLESVTIWVRNASALLEAGKVRAAVRCIGKAIGKERTSAYLARRLRKLESKIARLAKKELTL